jgi:PKD repeat protein
MKIFSHRLQKHTVLISCFFPLIACFMLLPFQTIAQSRSTSFSQHLSSRIRRVQASFAYSPVYPVAGRSVQFRDTSGNTPTSWQWDFGDGTRETSRNPSHAFPTKGFYKVSLTASNSAGSRTVSRTVSVLASASAATSAKASAASFTYSPASPVTGTAIQFTDTSTNSPTSWQWHFGDGTTSTAQNPRHTYGTSMAYNVTLGATNNSGTLTTSQVVTVLASSTLSTSFTFSPVSPAASQAVQFTDTSTGSPTSWQWNFGDGSTSTVQNPSHAFATAASYTVTLTATNSSGSQGVSHTVTVVPALTASFTFSPASPAAGQVLQFTDTSTGSPTSWQWNFGDGSTSTVQNPTHTFATAASYTVTLTATNSSGSQGVSHTVTVVPALTASFTFSPASPVVGQAIQFTDTSTGSPTSWQWSFGDGSSSTAQSPSHAFATAASYAVTLTVSNASGSKNVSRTVTVAPAASFTYSPSSPVAGQAVQFTDTSTGKPTSWQWSFGDGATSTVQNPSHTFTAVSSYTVTLTVSGSGSNSISQTINVLPSSTLTPSFTYSPSSPVAGQAVQFTDTSTGSPTSWQWNFGDGSTSTVQNPSHTFAMAASYTVILTATNSSGSQSASRTVTVVPALTASFSFTPASPAAGQAVQFTDTSTGSPSSWQWNFGDGATSSSQNPSHTYASATSYTVTLTATNSSGSKTAGQTVTVVPALTASFTYSPASPAAGQTVQFTDTSTGSPTSWQWDFGDGTSSTVQNPSHAYTVAGSYLATFTIRTGSNLNSTSRTITVGQSLTASFTYSPSSPLAGQAVQFTDTSTGSPTSWQWNFGDGANSTAQNPSHTFATSASYTVSLTVNNSSGSKSVSQTVNILPASTLTASFSYSPTSPTANQVVQFTDTSTGTPVAWQWNFGDGITSMAQNPSHTFAAVSPYTVSLTVSNNSGSNSTSRTITVFSASTMIPSDRLVDWSRAGVWVDGVKGIPIYPVGITVNTTTPSHQYYCDPTGTADCSTKLQAAITACPAGYVVYMPAGTYRLDDQISLKSRTVLRGAGAGTTTLVSYASGTTGLVQMSGSGYSETGTSIVSGYAKGSTSIVLSDASSFSVGNLVLIDCLNDPNFVTITSSEGICTYASRLNGTRALAEMNHITAKSGNTLTLEFPLCWGYSAALSPEISIPGSNPIVNAGVENLSITCGNTSLTDCTAIQMVMAYGCWVKGVETYNIPRMHVYIQGYGVGCEVRNNYFHDSASNTSDHGYAVSMINQQSYTLVEDNITKNTHCMVAIGSSGGAGNVIAYNYCHNVRHYQENWFIEAGATHGAHTMFNLWEGNIIPKFGFDYVHGSGSHELVFRNYVRGECPDVPITNNLCLMEFEEWNSYISCVGNILGHPGFSGTYNFVSGTSWCLYKITDSTPSTTLARMIRHGNYDYVNLAVSWEPTIADHHIPDSYYLSSKPAWFGSLDWPAIGPDVPGYTKNTPSKLRWDTYVSSGVLSDLFSK